MAASGENRGQFPAVLSEIFGSTNRNHQENSALRPGKPLRCQAKEIVLNVWMCISKTNPCWSKGKVTELTSKMTGVSERSVRRTRKEKQSIGKVISPRKTRPTRVAGTPLKYDSFTVDAIRRVVHKLFREQSVPTLDKVLQIINDDNDLPNISRTTLWRLLRKSGFCFRKSRQNIIYERDDIVAMRRHYLKDIAKYRSEGRKIYYTDETWFNSGDCVSKEWVDLTIKTPLQAFKSGLTLGLRKPNSKGKRLIIGHIGSVDGFAQDCLLLFRAGKQTGDYHHEMNGGNFMKWMEVVLEKLEPNSVIVLDNAPYHTVNIDPTPNSWWLKKDIQEWCIKHNAYFQEEYLKAELLQVVAAMKLPQKKYVFDERAQLLGFKVLRLPPYHCSLNPIEMVRSQVKRNIRAHNTDFNIDNVEQLVRNAVANVTPQQWENYIQHVIKEEKEFWETDGIVDAAVEKLIISLGPESDSDSDDNDMSIISDYENWD